jgi:uncharacterized OB-fold protein
MKPLPKINADSRPYWEGCLEDRLRFQRCDACGRAQFPPGAVCTHCHGSALTWKDSIRAGTVHSYTVVQRSPTADFKGDVPYVIALIDMQEGFRLMTNVRGDGALDTRIGDAVTIIFELTAREDVKLPQAVRTGANGAAA